MYAKVKYMSGRELFGDNCVATRLLKRDARHLFHFFNLDTGFQTEYKRTVCCLNLTS